MKPILFNTEMVRALLEGRKTVTRRLLKPQPEFLEGETGTPERCNDGNWCFKIDQYANIYDFDYKPPYQPGDILYVRETWCEGKVAYGEEPDGRGVPFISQCPGENDIILKAWAIREGIGIEDVVWKPSIFMPKGAAQLFLRVKSVRVERLQEITEDGAISEGFYRWPLLEGHRWIVEARSLFISLWNTTIKKADLPTYGWDANPWVWVIEFERISKEEALK